MSPTDDWSRDFFKRADNGSRMLYLKDRQIRTVVDGDRMIVMDAKRKKSSVVASSHVRRPGVEVTVHIVDVTREGGKNKDLGTRNRRNRRSEGRKGRPGGRRFFSRIHGRRWRDELSPFFF